MRATRLEAFSDAVIAILITIMVLELKVPHGVTLAALAPLWPVFLSYVLSFLYLAIYWNNHHHLLHLAGQVDGRVLWANMLLLFCLSLLPFASAWVGENHVAPAPAAFYGMVLLAAGCAWRLLQATLICRQGDRSVLKAAVGVDVKGALSILAYGLGIGAAYLWPWLSLCIYAAVAAVWLVPDRRLERLALAPDQPV